MLSNTSCRATPRLVVGAFPAELGLEVEGVVAHGIAEGQRGAGEMCEFLKPPADEMLQTWMRASTHVLSVSCTPLRQSVTICAR